MLLATCASSATSATEGRQEMHQQQEAGAPDVAIATEEHVAFETDMSWTASCEEGLDLREPAS